MIWFHKESVMDADEYIADSAIFFDEEDLPKLIKLFKRALNTWSPPDPELIKLLEDMKK